MTKGFEWSGRVGDVWAAEWRRTDRSFADLALPLDAAIRAVAPAQGTVIDLGCGAGSTAIALASARPELTVTGVDLSPALLAIAAERAAGLANLSFELGNTAELGPRHADLLVSRHGVMFFDDPVAGFAAIRAAAAPGAPLVFSCFRARSFNRWALVIDAAIGNDGFPAPGYAPGPYGLADRDFTADVLAQAGWIDASAEAIDFSYVAGAGPDPVDDAVDFLSHIGSAARALADAAPERRAAMLDSLRTALAEHVRDGQIEFPAAAWLWTARAGEPE